MHKLSNTTIRLISSSQVITSVYAAVKELVENSIDAQSTSIEVRLDNFGLKKIEVVDNGHGIPDGEEEYIAKPHFTSKLKDHSDLTILTTLGFRGEALHSLCTVSNLSFSTRTENQPVGTLFTLDKNGNITDRRPCTRQNGATMVAENLFKNLPVRKQFYSGSKKGKEELKKIQDLLSAYGLILPELRITLKHNQSVIWQKVRNSSLKDAFISTFGITCYKEMQQGSFESEDYKLKVTYILPNCSATEEICRNSSDKIFLSINKRPVMLKNICQVIKSCCNEFVPVLQNRYPVAFLAIDLPTSFLDVNVEPNKSVVLMKNMKEIKDFIESSMCSIYKQQNGQGLSKEYDSNSFGTGVFGCNASNPESAPLELENDDYQNQGKSQHFLSLSISGKNSNMCHFPSSDDSLVLVEKSCKVQASQSMKENRINYFDNSDECFLDVEINSKSPRMDLKKTDDHLIRKDLSPEKSPWCLNAEKSNSADENYQDIDKGSAQCNRASGCLNSMSQKAPPLAGENLDSSNSYGDLDACSVGSRIDFGGSAFNIEEKLSEDSSANKSASHIAMGQQSSSSNSFLEEVENSDERINIVRRSTSGHQVSIDDWSRGTGIMGKRSGEPLQPFRILDQGCSHVAKKQSGRKRKKEKLKMVSDVGFIQTTLSTTHPAESLIKFDISDIKQRLVDNELCASESSAIDVIGEISPWKSWVIRLKSEFYFFNPFRAYERELFNKLMKSHVLPSNVLPESILVTESTMRMSSMHGSRNWQFLQKMPFERVIATNRRCLVDDRVSSNGIEVCKRKVGASLGNLLDDNDLPGRRKVIVSFYVGSNETLFEIFKLCTEIKEYGVSELNEIIDKIHERSSNGNISSLEKYRPKKVIHYLKREAARLVKSSTTVFTRDEINNLALKVLPENEQYDDILCLHERPVFFNLDTISL